MRSNDREPRCLHSITGNGSISAYCQSDLDFIEHQLQRPIRTTRLILSNKGAIVVDLQTAEDILRPLYSSQQQIKNPMTDILTMRYGRNPEAFVNPRYESSHLDQHLPCRLDH